MLTCLAMSGVSTLFSVLLTPFFLGLFQKRQIKFDKKIVFVLAILLYFFNFSFTSINGSAGSIIADHNFLPYCNFPAFDSFQMA